MKFNRIVSKSLFIIKNVKRHKIVLLNEIDSNIKMELQKSILRKAALLKKSQKKKKK